MAGITMLAAVEARRAWRTMVLLGLLAGLGLGIALASVQVAQRTSTAFERLEQTSGTPDAIVIWVGGTPPEPIGALPGVESAWDAGVTIGLVEGDSRSFLGLASGRDVPPRGLLDPILVDGRTADPSAPDELVLTEAFAEATGFAVGDVLSIAALTAEEVSQFDTGFGEPDGPRLRLRVVGVVRSALGAGENAIPGFATPAFASRMEAAGATSPAAFVRLRRGPAGIPAFERRLDDLAERAPVPVGSEEFSPYVIEIPSLQRPGIALTARVLVIGVLVFGGIAGLSALLVAALALRRQLQIAPAEELRALAAIGVTDRQVAGAHWVAALPFTLMGAVTAVGIALVGGTIGPIGSIGSLEPAPGFRVDGPLLAAGTLVALVSLAGAAALAAAPPPISPSAPTTRASRTVARLTALGASPPVVLGTALALDPGGGRGPARMRPALVSTALVIAGLVGVAVFATSLDRLVESPSRWGWNADLVVYDANDDVVERLEGDERIAALAPVADFEVRVDGRRVTASTYSGARELGWTATEGRGPRSSGEVMLGGRLARSLQRGVGDRVTFRDADGESVSLAVVGVGVGPQLANGSFGSGLVVAPADAERLALTQPQREVSVALTDVVDPDHAVEALAADLEIAGAQPPPEVDNLSQLGRLPELLTAFLALLAVAVLAHSTASISRRRRRELDTLRAVGFVRRQARGVIVVASVTTVGVGLVIGTALGLLLGSLAWRATARSAFVTGDVAVSAWQLVAFAAISLVLAVVVALVPARRVTRTTVAAGLRTD